MRRKRFSREQILEADSRDILEVAKELNLPLERKRNTYKVSGYGGLYITPEKNAFNCFSANLLSLPCTSPLNGLFVIVPLITHCLGTPS